MKTNILREESLVKISAEDYKNNSRFNPPYINSNQDKNIQDDREFQVLSGYVIDFPRKQL